MGIIIIKSFRQHTVPPSLSLSLNPSLSPYLPAGPWTSLLVGQHRHIHADESIEECYLGVYFISPVVCLVRFGWMFFEIGGNCPYSWYFVWCYIQNLFKTAGNILVKFPSSFFFMRFVSVHTAITVVLR